MAVSEQLNITGSLSDALALRVTEVVPAMNTLEPWAFALIMAIAAIVLSQLAAYLLSGIIKAATAKTKTDIDDIILGRIAQPLAWIIFSLLIYIALAPLTIPGGFEALVEGILLAANIVLIAWLVHRFVSAVFIVWKNFADKTTSGLDDTMLPILSKFAKAAVWIAAGISLLAAWGIQIGPFLAGLGIAGVAIGFAVKDSLANIFGGISLALDHAYKVGDKVKLQDGTVGIVNDITLRSTRIQTYDGDMVMVPNGKVANDNIYTYAQPAPKSRGQVNFGVVYGAKPEKVKKIVLNAIKDIEGISQDPEPGVHFISMGDFALNFRAYFWLESYKDVWSTERQATEAVYNALNKAKIGIPFPTSTVFLKK